MNSLMKNAKKGFLLLIVLLFAWNGYNIAAKAAGNYTVSEIDENRKGSIRIEKYVTDLKDGSAKPAEGVSYQLTYQTRLDGGEVKVEDPDYFREVRATDASGVAAFTDLALGTYLVEEVSGTPAGYEKSAAFLMSVPLPNLTEVTYDGVTYEPGSIYEYDVTAKPKCQPILGAVRLIKTDAETGKRLKGAVFALFREDGTRYLTETGKEVRLSTDSNGTLEIHSLPFGSYYLQEEEAPEGYRLSKAKQTFQITQSYQEGNPDTLVLVEMTNTRESSETEPPTEPSTEPPTEPPTEPVTPGPPVIPGPTPGPGSDSSPTPTKITVFHSPKTADDTDLNVWIALLCVSAVLAGGLSLYRNKKRIR